MEKMSFHFDGRFFSSIDLITNNRTSQKRTMQSDLMRSSGNRMKFQQSVVLEALNCFVFRDRFAPTTFGNNGHPPSMAWITSNVRFHAAGGGRWFSVHKSQIGFFNLSQTELILQPAMGAFVFCQENQPRGIFVESMDNTRPFLPADPFEFGIISKDRIDKRSARMARCWVDYHSCRFIDYDQIIILKQNIQRNIFRDQISRRGWRNPNHHL